MQDHHRHCEAGKSVQFRRQVQLNGRGRDVRLHGGMVEGATIEEMLEVIKQGMEEYWAKVFNHIDHPP